VGYRLSRRAEADVVAVYVSGAARFGPARAEAYQASLIAAFETIAAHPGIAREREEFSPPVRLHPHGAHLIAYAAQAQGVLILRVLHGRQDFEAALG
jgi:toxin ParE1/3/4